MEQFFGAERGKSGDAHNSDTRDYSGVPNLQIYWGILGYSERFDEFLWGRAFIFMSWDKSQLPKSFEWGQQGQLSGAQTESLCFQPSATLVASKPRLLGLNDSHFFAASLVNFLCFRALCLFVHPLPSSFYLLEFV